MDKSKLSEAGKKWLKFYEDGRELAELTVSDDKEIKEAAIARMKECENSCIELSEQLSIEEKNMFIILILENLRNNPIFKLGKQS